MIVQYHFDPGPSRFTVQAFAGGLLSVFAHSPTFAVRGFEGGMQFDDQSFAEAALALTVKADSLELTDQVKPQDRQEIETRMRQEVLDTGRFPEITFGSTDVSARPVGDHRYRVLFRGTLSLHGLRRPHQVEADLQALGDEIRLSGTCGLALSAYQLKRVTALGGMITVKDELKVAFDLVGRRDGQ